MRTVETNPIVRYRKRQTRGNAIKAMCSHCMGCTDDHIEPGFREAIKHCQSTNCPLFAFRPFQPKDTAA